MKKIKMALTNKTVLWPYDPRPLGVWVNMEILGNLIAADDKKQAGEIFINGNGDPCYPCGRRLLPKRAEKYWKGLKNEKRQF